MSNKFTYILVGVILFTFSYFVLDYNREIDRDNYLHQKTREYTQSYNTVYNNHKKLSEVIFTSSVNTLKVQTLFYKRDRKALYSYLLSTYKLLKKYNIKQFHFHLPNNHSFLRFHRPNKYGDDLTKIRETVKYVNLNKKPTDGFEEGRVHNAYRFVFPMFYKKQYIGSIETSFSSLAFTAEISKIHNTVCDFLISKDIVDTKDFQNEKSYYTNSPYKNFYRETKTTNYIDKTFGIKADLKVSRHTKQLIESLGIQNNSFSLYDSLKDEVMTFIKVKNPITKKTAGLFIAKSDATFIHKQELTFKIALLTLDFAITAILFFLYRDNKYKITLANINRTLEEKVQNEVAKNREKDKAMFQQSRLAHMGEMISMIAHQWRQPLTAISATSTILTFKAKLDALDNDTVIALGGKISDYTQHLSHTIDDFRGFFQANKNILDTTYKELIDSVLSIVEISLTNKNIQLKQELHSEVIFSTYPSELKQVILNLIKNAEDILLEKEIKNPIITIETQDNILRVKDNAGGVSSDIIEKIFDPYFSTKTAKNGTGLGLYMSRMIIQEHCSGELRVYNDASGAVFEITLPFETN